VVVLNVNRIEEGMILAEDVRNKHGNVVLKKGVVLTKKYIMGLKAWGISEAETKDLDKPKRVKREKEAVSTDVIRLVEAELNDIFSDYAENSVMHEIYRVIKRIKVREAMIKKIRGNKVNGQD